ncbi:MAG: hypothetical protein M1837_005336 [Sclerophora amabilis]|nr:MAG: hypothetical protein M1837_005336 [Sclerophora amabilis]
MQLSSVFTLLMVAMSANAGPLATPDNADLMRRVDFEPCKNFAGHTDAGAWCRRDGKSLINLCCKHVQCWDNGTCKMSKIFGYVDAATYDACECRNFDLEKKIAEEE